MHISEKLLTDIAEDAFMERTIVFEDDEIDDEQMPRLVEALSTNTHIKMISLIETAIGDRSAILLSTLKNLETVNIVDSKITGIGAKALLTSNLRSLNLDASNLGDEGFEDIENNETLEYLNVSCNRITSHGAKFIAKSKTIKKLDFTQNRLDDECTPYLARMRSLKTLILTTNRITNVGERILKASNIEEIGLAQNAIRYEGPPQTMLVAYALERKLAAEAAENAGEQAAVTEEMVREAVERQEARRRELATQDEESFERLESIRREHSPKRK